MSLMSFDNFGTFSGQGWLKGPREATNVHLRITLPISGEYQLHAHIRSAGHRVAVGDIVNTVDGGLEFTLVHVGDFQLQAGALEIVVTLPAGGSIDYITLKAPGLPAITPDRGWQPDEALTWGTIQTTLLQLLDLAELFPLHSTPLTYEAEDVPQDKAQIVDISHLGLPSGGKWLRTGPLPAEVSVPIRLSESGFYDLKLRAMGDPILITVGDRQQINLGAKPYLDDYSFPALFLTADDSDITLSLPPGGGVDQLVLTGRQIDTPRVETLLGMSQQREPEAGDINTLASILAAFGAKR